jgi:hypothetical protein
MWWLTPAILATWEVEIKRNMVQGQYGQKIFKTTSQPIKTGHGSTYLSSQMYGKYK